MKRTLLLLAVLLFGICFSAQAQITRLDVCPEEWAETIGSYRYVTGLLADEPVQTTYLLIDSFDFNGYYFHMNRTEDERCWGSLSGVYVPEGWHISIGAADSDHCWLELSDVSETRTYYFGFVSRNGEGDWHMERYTIERSDYSFEAVIPGLWRMEITQTENGSTQYARAAFFWYNDCYHLHLDGLPGSIEEARRLEAENPVAAVAPQDASSRVNLREGASTGSSPIGNLYSGVMLKVLDSADAEWVHVNPLSGATKHGYIKRSLLAFGEDIWDVQNATRDLYLSSGSPTVPASYLPYHGRYQTFEIQSDVTVNIIGYYNDEWAMMGSWPGAHYVETKYLHQP